MLGYSSLPAYGHYSYPVGYVDQYPGKAIITTAAPKSTESTEESKSKTSPTLTLEDCVEKVKSVEDSVFDAFHQLEMEHYAIHVSKSEDFTTLYHQAETKATEYRLKLESVKSKLSDPVLEEANKQKIFAAAATYSPSTALAKPHPFEELKSLRERANLLRRLLEEKVKAEQERI